MTARRGGLMEGGGGAGAVMVRSLSVRVETTGPGSATGDSSIRLPILVSGWREEECPVVPGARQRFSKFFSGSTSTIYKRVYVTDWT